MASDEAAPAQPEETTPAPEGGEPGEDQGDKDNKPGGPTLPRTRVSTYQHLGQVWEWRGNYGWILPFEQVKHPKAGMRQGRIFVSRTDLANSRDLMPGTFVQFQIFEDEQGLGAEKCYAFKGPPNFLFKGKGKGKGKKGEGKGKGKSGDEKTDAPEGAAAVPKGPAPGGGKPSGEGKGGKGKGAGRGRDGAPGAKGDRPKGEKGKGRKGKGPEDGKGGKSSGGMNSKGAGRGGLDRDGGKGRGKSLPGGPSDRTGVAGPGGMPGQAQPAQKGGSPMPSQQVPQQQLQPQLGMGGGAGGFGLMPGMPNFMELPGANLGGMSVPQGLQNLQNLPNLEGLQGLQGLQGLPNLQSLGLANPAWAAAFVQQPQVPARNMGPMPSGGTTPAGMPGYMDLGDNLRSLQGAPGQASYKGAGLASGQGFMG